jgi:hypothetical protein
MCSSAAVVGGIGTEVMAMAQVIDFYIPESFRRKIKWIPADQRGKVIEFAIPGKTPGNSKSA